MKPAECLRILGLPARASPCDIKRAYRRLALKFHPDAHDGDEEARCRFIQISTAYHALMRAARGHERKQEIGVCGGCGQLGAVFHSPDGKSLCERCILKPRGTRFLPLPTIVVVKCTLTTALIAVAAGCLVAGWVRESTLLLAVACGTGFLGLLALGVTCVAIRHCTQPAEIAMCKRLARRQASAANRRVGGR